MFSARIFLSHSLSIGGWTRCRLLCLFFNNGSLLSRLVRLSFLLSSFYPCYYLPRFVHSSLVWGFVDEKFVKRPPVRHRCHPNTLSLLFSTWQNHKSWTHQSYQEITISFEIDRKFHRIDVPSSFKFSSITWNYEPRRFHPLSAHSNALSARRQPRDYISMDDSAEQEKPGHI